MGWDCPCGASVGTQRHWCEALQARHAERLERLAALQVQATLATTDGELELVREGLRELEADEGPGWGHELEGARP